MRETGPAGEVPPEAGGLEVVAPEAERLALARRYLDPQHALWPGNRCQLLRDGVEAYPSMLEAIRSARRFIRLETYMFIDDAVGELFGRALAGAAERGVRVTVLYDWLGSWVSGRSFFKSLRTRGVDIRPFKPFSLRGRLSRLIRRDHRKLLVVDGEVAFVGGVNIASHWAPIGEGAGWRDDVLRIEGPAAAQLERRFQASWRMQWKDRLLGRLPMVPTPSRPRGEVRLCVLTSRRAIHASYLRAIAAARKSVLISAAYFVPDRKMLAALREAARRGVEVLLVMAGKSDHPEIQFASRALYERLMSWGVKVHEWGHGVLHAKTAVVDGAWGTVGSFNLERMSLRFNHEVNVFFADPRIGRELERSVRLDAACSRPIDLARWRSRPWWTRMLERVAHFFRRVL
ncbi:MAG: cardiolipin synthase B [Myxococcales bacterium]|nr:cardiolipin synthase B [Myxococcales bacterium]